MHKVEIHKYYKTHNNLGLFQTLGIYIFFPLNTKTFSFEGCSTLSLSAEISKLNYNDLGCRKLFEHNTFENKKNGKRATCVMRRWVSK